MSANPIFVEHTTDQPLDLFVRNAEERTCVVNVDGFKYTVNNEKTNITGVFSKPEEEN